MKHTTNCLIKRIAIGVLLSPLCALGHNQQAPDKKDSDLIVCPVHVVFVEVVVRDDAGRPVSELSMADFKVYEDGARQVIDFWQREEISSNGESAAHYRIGYYPMNEELEDRYRRIKVRAASKGKGKYEVQILAKELEQMTYPKC